MGVTFWNVAKSQALANLPPIDKNLITTSNCSREQRHRVILKVQLSKKPAWLIKKPVELFLGYMPGIAGNRSDIVWEIKYWCLWKLNIHQFNRLFWLLLCDPCDSLHNTEKRLHRKTACSSDLVYLKAVCSPKTYWIADFFTRGKVLSSLHLSKRLKAKYPHTCWWKWGQIIIEPCIMYLENGFHHSVSVG